MISTLSGTGDRTTTPDSAALSGTPLLGPRSIDCDRDGNAYLVLREGNAVFKLDLNAGRLQRIAGTGHRGYSGDGGPGLNATFSGPKESPIPALITAFTSLTLKITSYVGCRSTRA